jgi:hypothetical protein
MHQARSLLLVASFIGLGILLTACGSTDTTVSPGGPGGADGAAGSAGTTLTGGAGGTTGGGGADASGIDGSQYESGTGAGTLGAACASQADCTLPLQCIPSTGNMIPGGGPANGMCTLTCTASSECTSFGGLCKSVTGNSDNKWCVQSCTLGGPSATKCNGRRDQACFGLYDPSFTLVGGACFPLCGSDADCAARKCDAASGMCVDGVPSVIPLGAPCDSNNSSDVCAAQGGTCLFGACTASCRYGSFEGCGYRRTPVDAAPGPVGACFQPVDPNVGNAGDVGFCWQLCDGPADCLVPGWICDMASKSTWGHGFCNTPSGDGGAPPGDAAADSAPASDAAQSDATSD